MNEVVLFWFSSGISSGPSSDVLSSDTFGWLIKINAVIENTGDQDAQDISWSLRLNGGSILIGRQTTGMIQAIPPGGKVTIVSKIILGIGLPSVVLVEAGIEQGSQDVEVQSANIIGSFINIT